MSDRPNILWICTDQQRYDTIAALGNPYVSTPHIDRLVRGGVAFDYAYCQSPICTPSRASFLTGLYASTVRMNRNGNDVFPDDAPPPVTRMLADVGYDCGLIGKLHLASAYGRIEPRTDDGYRYWQYSHAPRDDWEVGHDYADWVREKGEVLGELTKSVDGVPADFHQTTWCAEKTIEFIKEERGGQPWLASVNIYDPHPPFNPPKTYRDQFDPAEMPGALFQASDLEQQQKLEAGDFQSKGKDPKELDINSPIVPRSAAPGLVEAEGPGGRDDRTLQAAYYAMIKLIDDQLGRVLQALEETEQLENTIVIFMSDHGETLGDHGLIQKGCRFYEGLVRVPLIFYCPGRIQEGIVSDALVEIVDVMPTILDFAGERVPSYVEGRSLLPILSGERPPSEHREGVRCEYFDALDQPDETRATMWRTRQFKLCVYHGHGLGELYDLEQDPNEFNNLWDDPEHQGVKAQLLHESFDAAVRAVDLGPDRVGPM